MEPLYIKTYETILLFFGIGLLLALAVFLVWRFALVGREVQAQVRRRFSVRAFIVGAVVGSVLGVFLAIILPTVYAVDEDGMAVYRLLSTDFLHNSADVYIDNQTKKPLRLEEFDHNSNRTGHTEIIAPYTIFECNHSVCGYNVIPHQISGNTMVEGETQWYLFN